MRAGAQTLRRITKRYFLTSCKEKLNLVVSSFGQSSAQAWNAILANIRFHTCAQLTWIGDYHCSEYRRLASLQYRLHSCIWTNNGKQVFSAGKPRVAWWRWAHNFLRHSLQCPAGVGLAVQCACSRNICSENHGNSYRHNTRLGNIEMHSLNISRFQIQLVP